MAREHHTIQEARLVRERCKRRWDCFLRSFVIADGCARGKEDNEEKILSLASDLRPQAVKHMKAHGADFEPFYPQDRIEKFYERAGLAAPKEFEDLLSQAAQRKYWANNFVIQTAANRTGIPIVIWSLEEGKKDQKRP